METVFPSLLCGGREWTILTNTKTIGYMAFKPHRVLIFNKKIYISLNHYRIIQCKMKRSCDMALLCARGLIFHICPVYHNLTSVIGVLLWTLEEPCYYSCF